MSQDQFDKNLTIFLQFLHDNSNASFTRSELENSINLSELEMSGVIDNALSNLWIDVENYNIGNPKYQINEAGNRKLNRLTGKAEPLPPRSNSPNTTISQDNKFAKWQLIVGIIGVIVAIAVGVGFFSVYAGEILITEPEPAQIVETEPAQIVETEPAQITQTDLLELSLFYEPPNPSLITNTEFGFQITVPDPEDYKLRMAEFVYSDTIMDYTDLSFNAKDAFPELPNIHKNYLQIDHLNPKIWLDFDIELLLFSPNNESETKNYQSLIQILNKEGITKIETQVESDVNGLWYIGGECVKWEEYNCKSAGWMNLYKSEEKLFLIHIKQKLDKGDPEILEIPDEIKFLINSFRPLR